MRESAGLGWGRWLVRALGFAGGLRWVFHVVVMAELLPVLIALLFVNDESVMDEDGV